jgi:hypothetical protein
MGEELSRLLAADFIKEIQHPDWMLARIRARPATKNGLKNSLYPHMHFTEHLVVAFGKPPRESDLNH